MSIVHVKRPDELVTCPYNPAHRVTSLRLPVHLLKCEKSAPRMATCPFNASHRISEADRAAHISTCPDKAYVERTLVTTKSNIATRLLVPSYETEIPEPTENWDAESNPLPTAGYDPTARMNETTFRNAPTLASMTKSQKKQFYNGLVMNRQNGASSRSSSTTDAYVESQLQQLTPVLKQLRLPKEEAIVEKAQQPSNRSLGLGRGHNRLAANIFQTNLQSGSSNSDKFSDFMAIARGRGMGCPSASALLPKVGKKENVAPTYLAKDFEDTVSESSKSEATSENSQTAELQPEKLKRKLQKKLRQIDVLISKQKNGETLNQEELDKIAKKPETLQLLNNLDA